MGNATLMRGDVSAHRVLSRDQIAAQTHCRRQELTESPGAELIRK
jgi:hypothetical protein